MSNEENPDPAAEEATPHLFHAAFDKTAPERAALSADDLVVINLDVPIMVTTVLGSLSRLLALRDEIVEALPKFEIAYIDNLQTYAQALAHAHVVYRAAAEPTAPLPSLVARASELRALLLSDASALANRKLIDGKVLTRLKGGPGYLNVCADVGVLVLLLRERWTEIAPRTAIRPRELDEAERLYERVTFAYADRARRSPQVLAAASDRQRAYTVLFNAYRQARRAVMYIRFDAADVDTYLPSLFAGRRSRRAKRAAGGSDGLDTGGDVAAAEAPSTAAANDAAPTGTAGFPSGSPFTAH